MRRSVRRRVKRKKKSPSQAKWASPSPDERLEEYGQLKHKLVSDSFIQYECQYGISIDEMLSSFNVLDQYHLLQQVNDLGLMQTQNSKSRVKARCSQALVAAHNLRASVPQRENAIKHNLKRLVTKSPSVIEKAIRSHQPTVYMSREDPSQIPVVIDTGASFSLTPVLKDFVGAIEASDVTSLNGLQGQTPVKGVGLVEWTIRDMFGYVRKIRTRAYYVPDAQVRLYSPQSHFQREGGGSLSVSKDSVILQFKDRSRMEFPFQDNSNLPMMLPDACFEPGLNFEEASMLSSPGFVKNQFLNVADERNVNLAPAQKELLQLHQKLGHAHFGWIRRLVSKPKNSKTDALGRGQILPTKSESVSTCDKVLCAACQMGKQTRRTPDDATIHKLPEREMLIRQGNTKPGDMVSIDQYLSSFGGRLPHTFGKEKLSERYQGGTIFVDHATGLIFIHNQVSLKAGETVKSKRAFEAFCSEHGVTVKGYRADNMPFNSKSFMDDIHLKNQKIDFSGVGAHHQNGVAERSIATVTKWARTMLLHMVLLWPDQADISLWPFALETAVYIWNNLPKKDLRQAPLELFAQQLFPSLDHLMRLHVFGCPVYVLDPKLQDGKKLPKWDPRVRRGMYLGPSSSHSTLVSRVLNLHTGKVTPQYHIVCDDLFTTIPNAESGGLYNPNEFNADSWSTILETGYELHLDAIDMNDPEDRLRIPELSDDWLTGPERRVRAQRRAAREARRLMQRELDLQAPVPPPDPHDPAPNPEGNGGGNEIENEFGPGQEDQDDQNFLPDDDDRSQLTVPEGVQASEEEEEADAETAPQVPEGAAGGRPRRQINPPARLIETIDPSKKVYRVSGKRQRRAERHPERQYGKYYRNQKFKQASLDQQFLASLDWKKAVSMLKSPEFAKMWALAEQNRDLETGTFEELHPLILAAKASSADNPTWNEAMNGPLSDGYWEAAKKEIETLQKMKAWEVVDREAWMNVLPSTWAFKCKRLPDGQVQKLKARFCVRGDHQIEGVDFKEDEIFSPVVSWNTVRLLLILSCIMGLETKQVDYTAAFIHAPLSEDEEVYVEQPRGFSEPGKVLKLNQCLYGLKQSPRNFYNHLKGNLEAIGFECQTEVDPCLFISNKCICLVYVDDTLFYAPKEEYIQEAIEKLEKRGMEMTIEDSVAGFLGVHIERNESNQSIKLTQKGLIKRIVEALDISDLPPKKTPATYDPLVIDKDGDPPDGKYSYASVVGMLLYLSGHSRPDIAFAVSQCARFIHNTKRSHEVALERIGQYLKSTMDDGLILKPTGDYDMECHVDADFAGLWPLEDVMDPTCVKSRTGFVISISGCPVIWSSKLQSDIAGSTMEAEYNALSTAMRDVIPMQNLFKTVGSAVGIDEEVITSFKTTVWEDNMGCLRLARKEPGQYTPRSKHYAVKYHWFRSHLKSTRSTVEHIDTSLQKADIFTKGLRTDKFEAIRLLLCGW